MQIPKPGIYFTEAGMAALGRKGESLGPYDDEAVLSAIEQEALRARRHYPDDPHLKEIVARLRPFLYETLEVPSLDPHGTGELVRSHLPFSRPLH